jgi:nucleotide-binding universal stress UspA family protein
MLLPSTEPLKGTDGTVPELPIMFKSILVPLDGSELAEQSLVPACRIAEKFGSELLLLRVVTPVYGLAGPQHLAVRADRAPAAPRMLMDEAEAYLTSLSRPTLGVSIRTRVLSGAPPELIVATASEENVDLIVMSTHGRAGLLRLLYGSVAEAVLRGTTVPVLLVPSRTVMRQAEKYSGSTRAFLQADTQPGVAAVLPAPEAQARDYVL